MKKRSARPDSPTSHDAGSRRKTPSRVSKQRAVERLKRDTEAVNQASLLTALRRQGYEELPIEEIQDRLSKLRTALAEFIVSRRA
ncbi:MAG: hypothetical protein HY444_06160 [Nitrospirae bacterium]|nr:hypothetical protein [Nitrospirota bacterium]